MAEPFSLAVNVVQIISACTSTIKTLDHLVQQYIDAGAKLKSLAAKASLVKATLKELDKTLKGRSSFFAKRIDDDSDLKSAIDQTLTGCWTVFLLLQKELRKWVPEEGKDPSFFKKAGLLFQDEIIQDYRIQIEGHVEGLKTVLVCLQAQTVAETHETLQKATAILEKIATRTNSIREQHKEISFPESIYEGFTTYEEDKPFDKELLNSTAYRAAFRARKNSLLNGDASMVSVSTQARKDFLSDQPEEEDLAQQKSNDLLNSDAVGDLISFGDDPTWTEPPAASPNAQLMAGLTWESHLRVPHILDGENAEPGTEFPNAPRRSTTLRAVAEAARTEDGSEVQIDDLLDDMLEDAVKHGVPRSELERGPRRDSGHPLSHNGSAASYRTKRSTPTTTNPMSPTVTINDGLVPVVHEDGLIPCHTEHSSEDLTTSALDRSASISTSGTRRLSSPTLGQFNLWPTSPVSQTPGILQLPADHRLSNPQDHIPQADEHVQESLLATMHHLMRSLDPQVQLNWAEDVLEHLAVTLRHEYRLASLNVRQKVAPTPLSEVEQNLREEATRIVENLRKAGYGRAYFLCAKYVVPEGEKEHLHLLAAGQRYHRSEYYLGEIAEKREIMGDALKRYKVGESYADAACLTKLAQAHMNGNNSLGIKKNREEGLRLLREAVQVADKDCPDPLHHLAMLYLDPPSTGVKGLSSKPLLQKSVPEAVTLFRRAALLGYGPSQLRLGQVHRTGYFDPKDAKKAAKAATKLTRTTSNKWPRRSSSSASPVNNTRDAEVDSILALHYLHLAARRGMPEADYEIAHDMLWNGGELDSLKQRLAYAHTARALLGNVPMANGLMGKCLEEGIGCKINLVKAEEFYFKGRTEGDEWARSRSDYLLNKGDGVAGGTDATYKKPTFADRQVSSRNWSSVY